ncbi:MAG: hypothetical protein EXR77_02440 [Myxococcales bacterium]|nr:hypothetical protein [Myxococcales bacterium]
MHSDCLFSRSKAACRPAVLGCHTGTTKPLYAEHAVPIPEQTVLDWLNVRLGRSWSEVDLPQPDWSAGDLPFAGIYRKHRQFSHLGVWSVPQGEPVPWTFRW